MMDSIANLKLQIPLGPVQHAFVTSTALENCIVGPRQEGKSFGGWSAIALHASRQKPEVQPCPYALCRDTRENLRVSAIPSAMKWEMSSKKYIEEELWKLVRTKDLKRDKAQAMIQAIRMRLWVEMKQSYKEIHLSLGGPVIAIIHLVGMDEMKDINRFQSWPLAGAWFEEPAPAAASDIGNGIQEVAWLMALSSMSYPVDKPRYQITMNPPDEDHWTWERFVNRLEGERVCFQIPRFENRKNLPEKFHENIERTMRSKPDMYRRMVLGRAGFVQMGQPVAANFDEEFHVSKERLYPNHYNDLYLGWDFGLNPTCVGVQQTAQGHMNCLFALMGENMGVTQFIQNILRPYMNVHMPKLQFFHIGDPQGFEKSQVDSFKNPVKIVQELLPGGWRSGPKEWEPRRQAIHDLLGERHLGRPLFLMDPLECKILIRALRGGWHYPDLPKGSEPSGPIKDRHSHPGDALAYLAHVLLRQVGASQEKLRVRPMSIGRRMAEAMHAGR